MLTERHQNSAKKCIGHPDLMTKKCFFSKLEIFSVFQLYMCHGSMCVHGR